MAPRYASIDAYVKQAPTFAAPIIERLRAAVHAGYPEVQEEIKWNIPFFIHHGPLCGVAAFKAHCRITFWKADVLVKDPAIAKALDGLEKIATPDDLPSPTALRKLVKAAAKLNEEGIQADWQKRVAEQRKNPLPIKVPAVLAAAFKKNAAAKKTWDAFPPSHKRDYALWIDAAKTDATRTRRVEQSIAWLAEGKKRNWSYEARR